MLYKDDVYDSVLDPFDVLNESIYLTIDESTIYSDMIPIIENSRLNTYLTESTYSYIPNTTVILDESDIIEDPTIIQDYTDYIVRPINEQHNEYQYILECIDTWIDNDYDDNLLLEMILLEFEYTEEQKKKLTSLTDDKIKKGFLRRFPFADEQDFNTLWRNIEKNRIYWVDNNKYGQAKNAMMSYLIHQKQIQTAGKEAIQKGRTPYIGYSIKNSAEQVKKSAEDFKKNPDDAVIVHDTPTTSRVIIKHNVGTSQRYVNPGDTTVMKIDRETGHSTSITKDKTDRFMDSLGNALMGKADPYSTQGGKKLKLGGVIPDYKKVRIIRMENGNKYKLPATISQWQFTYLPAEQRDAVIKNYEIVKKASQYYPPQMLPKVLTLNGLLHFDPNKTINSIVDPKDPTTTYSVRADGKWEKDNKSKPAGTPPSKHQSQPTGSSSNSQDPLGDNKGKPAGTPSSSTTNNPKQGNFLSNNKGKIGLGVGLAVGAGLAYKNRDKLKSLAIKGLENYQQYRNRPKSVIAKRIAALRGVYKKFMLEAQRNPKQANVFKRMAAKILSVIDKLLHYMQNKADGTNRAYNANY